MIIIDKNTCVGCEACANICPVGCITMTADEEGFFYPDIDESKCVRCNACNKVCIAENIPLIDKERESECYACISKNDNIREKSSSGGAFSAIASKILVQGGIVYGASFDDNMAVCHICIENEDELYKLRGSKYSQSRINDTYKQIKHQLDDGRTVLFSGTGCQINGLKQFLQYDYDKLFTVDILCHGVPSPLVFSKYLDYRNMGKINDICFKDKSNGWSKPTITIRSDIANYSKILYLDEYSLLFVDGVTLRRSCYNCYSQAGKNMSDISLGDFWGIDKIDKTMFDDKGTSLVIIKTDKGKRLIESIADDVILKSENIDDAIIYNPNIMTPTKLTERREHFFADFVKSNGTINFRHLTDKYCTFYNKSVLQKIKLIIKRIIGKE